MKTFTLYVGARQADAKKSLLKILRRHFESFTVITGEGYFKGAAEPMWFVKLATDTPSIIFKIAEEIRTGLDQEIIGIEFQSRYYSFTKKDPATELQASITD